MSATTHRLIPLTLALALLVGACGDDGDEASPGRPATSTSTTVAPTSTASAPTTATTPPPSTAGAPTSAAGGPATSASGDDVTELAEGAGCTPDGEALADGRWFGFVASPTATGFQLDVACWFTGEAAERAASEDGEESPPPNDYYVRNDNPRLRALALARPDVPVRWTRETGDPTTEVETPYAEWLAARSDGMVFGVWVEVRGGLVEAVDEQWVP